ncbi:MAG: 3-phosphoshikimate 1-carboxyvinyltransferase [Planctomycetaceae bacterium]|nr:3-phosphoshikimate 1-carboxyvinyltransferase [Planctomycetaceae bacterium]
MLNARSMSRAIDHGAEERRQFEKSQQKKKRREFDREKDKLNGVLRELTARMNDDRSPEIPATLVVKPTSRLAGTIAAPPSKSYAHRALMVAGLCDQRTIIKNPLIASDILGTVQAWWSLGATVEYDRTVNEISIQGVRQPLPRGEEIFVRESGTTLRFVLPGLAFCTQGVIVQGNGSLLTRTNNMIVGPLKDHVGMDVQGSTDRNCVPLAVKGMGYLPVSDVILRGNQSSQVVSSFLMWLPLAKRKFWARAGLAPQSSTIRIDGELVSKPYVDITIDVLKWAGIRIEGTSGSGYTVPAEQHFTPKDKFFRVPGDYSSAAFLLAAACLMPSKVTVTDLQADAQGDKKIVSILKQMGANITHENGEVTVVGPAKLHGIDLDCGDIPDLVPILCVLGACAQGTTRLTNIAHLKHKESDRLAAPTEQLRRMGAKISYSDDSITVEHSTLVPSRVSSKGDHRLAMSLMVAGLVSGGVEVEDARAIAKSYPRFVRDLRALGAQIDA